MSTVYVVKYRVGDVIISIGESTLYWEVIDIKVYGNEMYYVLSNLGSDTIREFNCENVDNLTELSTKVTRRRIIGKMLGEE